MAGDWIKMRTELHEDPAVVAIASSLEVDEFAVVGRLHRLWSWVSEQSRDGRAPGVTGKWVDRFLGCPGFADAMVLVGWLKVSEDGISIPRFDIHNGSSAKERAQNSARKRASRQKPKQPDSRPGPVATLSRSCPDPSATASPLSLNVFVPSPSSGESEGETPRDANESSIRGLSGAFTMRQIDAIREAYPGARVRGKHSVDRVIDGALRLIVERFDQAENPQVSAAGWLLARVRAFAKSPAGKRGEYTPLALTWFQSGGYDDKDEAWQRAPDEGDKPPQRDYAAIVAGGGKGKT